jgi:hypothetical protein
MPMKISAQDAEIMRSGSARFPMKGTTCVPACAFYWCCQNGEDGKNCVGFQLINGQVKRHLQEQLGEDALKYIENAYGFIQLALKNENLEGVEVITRDVSQLRERTIPEPEETDFAAAMMRGFGNIQGNVSPMAAPSLEEATYPERCSDQCKFVTCPYRKEENYNKPCLQRFKPLKRSLDPNYEE